MDISGEHFIAMPRTKVWAALNDPDVVRHCIPGCRSLARISPTAMRGTVEVKIGPVKATFNGTLTQSEINAPASCRLTAEGDGGSAGFGKGTADVTLNEENAGTRLRYTAHAEVAGKLAEVGARMIDTTAKQMADQFFGKLSADEQRLAQRLLMRLVRLEPDGRTFRLETVTFEDHADCFHHVTGGGDLGRPAVGEAAGQAGFELGRLVGFVGHLRST